MATGLGVQPEQILIATTAAWQSPNATLQRIAQWIGRGSDYHTPALAELLHAGVHTGSQTVGREYPEQTMNKLRTYFQPYNAALLELLQRLPFDVHVPDVAAELHQLY